jgi:hypothetical protein
MEHSGKAESPAVFPVLAQTDQDMPPILRHVIRRLTLARDAMKMALLATSEAPHKASAERLTPAQVLACWHSANLLLDTMFGNLNSELRNAMDVMEIMVPASDRRPER